MIESDDCSDVCDSQQGRPLYIGREGVRPMEISPDHRDVVIVGAGLSGIAAAVQLRTDHPGRSFVMLDQRADLGGTWDLFRYPGIRSDSDMYTLGYSFKPWT